MVRTVVSSWDRRLGWSASTLIACFLAAASTSRASEGSVLFESAFLSTDLDPGAGRVTIADLNGDGYGDLAMPNGVSSCVSILLGHGNGTFGSKTDFPTGIAPSYVASADLDGDGRLDLVVSNSGASTVSILLGRGDGTFGAKMDLPSGASPWEVAVADLNGDAKPDLVTSNHGSNTVSVLLGNGDGTFGAPLPFVTADRPRSITIGDLNGDRHPDLVVTNNTRSIAVHLGLGDGTFGGRSDLVTETTTVSVAIGELTGDGNLDLAVTRGVFAPLGPRVSILPGNGDGTFGTSLDLAVGSANDSPVSVAIGDFNADGGADLAVTSMWSASVLMAHGDGTFSAPLILAMGSYCGTPTIGDLDHDGDADLVVTRSSIFAHPRLSVFLGHGDGTFGRNPEFPIGEFPTSAAIGDFNQDGRPDLAVANSHSNSVSLLLGNGDGRFGVKTDVATGLDPFSVGIGDLNNDDKQDLVVANLGSHTVSVFFGNGDGRFGARTDLTTGLEPISVAIADVNHDGRLDLSVVNRGSNTVSVLLGIADGSFGMKTDFATGLYPSSVASADVDGDGNLDLAITNRESHSVSLLLGAGDGTFAAKTDFSAGAYAASVASADFNGDAKIDLAVASGSRTASVLIGNGDGTFGPAREFETGGWHMFPQSVAIGDLNADCRPDIVTANMISDDDFGTLSVLLGNGDGTFSAKTDYATGGHNLNAVVIGDLNSDGALDVTVVDGMRNVASPLLNVGIQPLRVDFALSPLAMNLRSSGQWVTGTLEPLPPFMASQITVGSVRLNGTVPVDPSANPEIGDRDGDHVPDLSLRFDRRAVARTLSAGAAVPITITGAMECGQTFTATALIRVLGGSSPGGTGAGRGLRLVGPNPVRAGRGIGFMVDIPRAGGHVSVRVLDVRGQVVARLLEGQVEPGSHQGHWDASDVQKLPTGIYFLHMQTEGEEFKTRVVLLK